MPNLARLRRTLRVATDLTSIVGTMKTLAAVNIRHFDDAAAAIDGYVTTVELALQIALRDIAPEPTSTPQDSAWIVFGSDQGLCGPFNQRVSVAAIDAVADGRGPLVVIGHRAARRIEAAGITPQSEFRTPGSVSGITSLVTELLVLLVGWLDSGDIDGVGVVHNHAPRHGGLLTRTTRILPLDDDWLAELRDRPWESRVLPTHPHDPEELFRWLLREWVFARLYFACSLSLAAENSARLVATQAAERSLQERTQKLSSQYRTERQQAITQELLDLRR